MGLARDGVGLCSRWWQFCFGWGITSDGYGAGLRSEALDYFDQVEVASSLSAAEELINSGIFSPKNASESPFFKPAFIALLIELRALMYKAERYAEKISFTDDVLQRDKVKDVSDLIRFVRDALCHPDSDHHFLDNGARASFNVYYGRGELGKIDNHMQESLYEDDVCFFFGMQSIYLKRHIHRALQEAYQKLSPLLVDVRI